jgi:hypothetical protein
MIHVFESRFFGDEFFGNPPNSVAWSQASSPHGLSIFSHIFIFLDNHGSDSPKK